jgi:hypothetical protein
MVMNNNMEEIRKFNGLWTVDFISTLNRSGKGVIVLSNKRLFGGDSGYYYTGSYNINNGIITADIIVIRYDPNWVSVFGPIDSFKLSFSGQANYQQFTAIGSIVGAPDLKIRIAGNKKEDF